MSTEIETPEAMARRLFASSVGLNYGHTAIRADREHIATWCDEHAAEAWRAASENTSGDGQAGEDRGRASAYEALAAILRGAR